MRAVQPLALALVVVSAMLIGIGAAWHSVAVTAPAEQCMDSDMREQVRMLILAGIDQALKEQVSRVFEMWMKDPSEQPKRALVGMHIGIDAYVRSRASAKKWMPPQCAP